MPLKTVFSRHEGDGVQITDEPTGNLDSRTSQDVLGLLKVTGEQFGQTIVMITHNEEIAQMADRVIRIEDGTIKSGASSRKDGTIKSGASSRKDGTIKSGAAYRKDETIKSGAAARKGETAKSGAAARKGGEHHA